MNRTGVTANLLLTVLVTLPLACHPGPALLWIQTEETAGSTRLTLAGAPGVRINARLKPALELDGGSVVRFDSPDVTADSSYFTSPPRVTLRGTRGSIHGRLRASICPRGENLCRALELRL